MIDGFFKASINRFWDRGARLLAVTGMSPNQLTWAGFVLVLLSCAFYVLHGDSFWFGVSLALIFAMDALDGALARVSGLASRYGGYLDAVVDRYQEVAVYLTLAWFNGYWLAGMLAVTGSLLVSYNKARVAVELPIDNDAWPDLLERMERVILICLALVLDPFVHFPQVLGGGLLWFSMMLIGVLAHVTAMQRFMRARRMLRENDRASP